MSLRLTTPPAFEPVTLAEAKAHLRLDATAEDAYVTALITTARLQIESALSIALLHQTWSYFVDAWPQSKTITLTLAPIAELVSFRTFDPNDSPTTHALGNFQLDGTASPPRLLRKMPLNALAMRALNGIEISFVAGFGATPTSVPAPIRHALLMLVAHWFENRELIDIEHVSTKIPDAISALLMPWRQPRLV
jgi:uncharacterized phiE125 gp8 family phage protein